MSTRPGLVPVLGCAVALLAAAVAAAAQAPGRAVSFACGGCVASGS